MSDKPKELSHPAGIYFLGCCLVISSLPNLISHANSGTGSPLMLEVEGAMILAAMMGYGLRWISTLDRKSQ